MTDIRLQVARADRTDAGRGVARLPHDTIIDLGVSPGDVVAVEGSDRTAATVWRAADDGHGDTVRLDRFVRENAGAAVGDEVALRRASPDPAERIALAPRRGESVAGENAAGMVKRELLDRPFAEGDVLPVTSYTEAAVTGGSETATALVVVSAAPDGLLTITEGTEAELRSTPVGDSGEAEERTTDDRETDGRVTYDDVGGLDEEIRRVRETIELPMRYPQLFARLGVEPPKGVLLHGPPGAGKTLLARAIATETDATFHSIAGPEIISRYYGQSEQQLRETFEAARDDAPSIVFIDELDAIAPKREDVSGDVERRVVAQLLTLLDGLVERGRVTVVGTTNRVDAVDAALRRPGRFDREIEIGVPDAAGREEILAVHTRAMPLGDDVDLAAVAASTQGFVGADVENLTTEAAMRAVRRLGPDLDDPGAIDASLLDATEVTAADFERALREVEPSALREVFVETPDVTWDDVGGLETATRRLRETIQWPLEYPETYDRAALDPATGVLLYGPPGTGKTLLARAVATEARSNFVSVKGPELFDRYVGESERGVREVFSTARENAPCVVFFDEIDALAATRGGAGEDTGVGERVVSQLLTELDGVEPLEDVVVVAATNRPDLVDDALVRPGRLDRHVAVPVPDTAARREIFEIHTADVPMADDVDLDALTARTDGYVGVDIAVVCREAATVAVRKRVLAREADRAAPDDPFAVTMTDFERALGEVDPTRGDGGRWFEASPPVERE